MFCYKCGANNGEGFLFCLKCGVRLIDTTGESQNEVAQEVIAEEQPVAVVEEVIAEEQPVEVVEEVIAEEQTVEAVEEAIVEEQPVEVVAPIEKKPVAVKVKIKHTQKRKN